MKAKVEEELEVWENGGIVLCQVVKGLIPAEPSQRDTATCGQTIEKKLEGREGSKG